MDGPIRELVDRAQMFGWKTAELLTAIENVANHQRLAYTDPDPEDDQS